jgi:glycosyltransferase involved in cell wall biosynthesis
MKKRIEARLGIQQRVLPAYRVPFFDALALECKQGLGVFAGLPHPEEAIEASVLPQQAAYAQAVNHHLLSGRYYLCLQSRWHHWLRTWQPAVLIMEANPRYLSSYFIMHHMKQRGLPLIGWGLGAPRTLGGVLGKLRHLFLNQFDALITYSRQGLQDYLDLGFTAQKIFVAYNAAVPRPIMAPPQRGMEFPTERAAVLYVGRLQERKRVADLIHACAAMMPERQPRLWVVGDGPERRSLEELAQQIYPATQFYGAQHGADLDRLFSRADLFVLPGTGGLAVQQAMSFALPVIVGQADGTQAELVRRENGWCLDAPGVEILTETLNAALSNIPGLRAKGLESYRIVREEVNLEKMVDVFVQAVNSVLEKQK